MCIHGDPFWPARAKMSEDLDLIGEYAIRVFA